MNYKTKNDLRNFAHSKNYKISIDELNKFSIKKQTTSEFCGETIYIGINFDKNKNKILNSKWSGETCSIMNASAEFICDHFKNLEINQALNFLDSFKEYFIVEENDKKFAAFLPLKRHPYRKRCVLLTIDLFHSTINEWINDN